MYNDKARTASSIVPILPGDTFLPVGQSYVQDVIKHFARRRYKSINVCLDSLNPATSNDMVVNFGPYRSGNFKVTANSDTTAALPQTAVMGMKDHLQLASWQSARINMNQYIAGGSGARQDEFNIESIPSTELNEPNSVSQLAPCGFAISGSNGTTALRGTVVHAVIITVVFELLDFVSSLGNLNSEVPEIRGSMVRQIAQLVKDELSLVSTRPTPVIKTEEEQKGNYFNFIRK
jgi:hypothetical protein